MVGFRHHPRHEGKRTQSISARYFGLTDRGLTREHNEDTFLLADLESTAPIRSSQSGSSNLGTRGFLALVADGMGGAVAGEVASEMAAATIHQHLVSLWLDDPEVSHQRFTSHLREAVEAANRQIHQYAVEHPDLHGMGTTATVAAVREDRLFLAQIGDSRAYLIRKGTARQLTRDQSLTQRLVDAGELTEAEAAASNRRNIILQALGPDSTVKVDLSSQALQDGDTLILCSDGLSNAVSRDEIARVVVEEKEVDRIGQRLVDLANQRGGHDNITVIVAIFHGGGLPTAALETPGYHEFVTGEQRPALWPTQSFPAVKPPAATGRRTSPTAAALGILAIIMAILGILRLLAD